MAEEKLKNLDESQIEKLSVDIDNILVELVMHHQVHPINLVGFILARLLKMVDNLAAHDIFLRMLELIKDRTLEAKLDSMNPEKETKPSIH